MQLIQKLRLVGFWSTFFSGHLNLGRSITIYGENAMNWAVNISTKKWGYICFTLPTLRRFKKGDWYFYLSPNATPWACTYYCGYNQKEKIRAQIRLYTFGKHNFNAENLQTGDCRGEGYTHLRLLNERMDACLCM